MAEKSKTPAKKSRMLDEVLQDMDTAQKAINSEPKKVAVEAEEKTEEVKVEVKKTQPPRQIVSKSAEDCRIVEKLSLFIDSTNSKIVLNPGTPDESVHVLAPAWDYLAQLKGTHVEVEQLYESGHKFDTRILVVHCIAKLVDNKTDKTLTKAHCVADTSEQFLEHQPLSAVYNLATTRAKSRAVQTAFASYMAQAKYSITPAEEIYSKKIDIEAV